MLRVLHCIYDDPENPWVGGGGALRVRELYRRLVGRVDATVVTGNFPGAEDRVIEGIRDRRVGAPRPYPWSRWTYGRAATRLLREGDFDVALFDFSVYTPIRLPRGRPVGLVVHMLHGLSATARWGRIGGRALAELERRGIRGARWISTTSRWMVSQLGTIAPDATIVPVGSGVPPEFSGVVRAEADFLLYYGRLDLFQKGLDVLLEAFALLSPWHPGLTLRIAGRGKDESLVREEVRRLGLQDRVVLSVGVEREEVLRLFSGAIALLMPSRLEGLPMVPAEAMAAGVPVVASDVGAIPEVIQAPDGGMLVPPGDAPALAAAVAALLADPERRLRMSDAARRAARRFSWDEVAEQHLGFLERIAAEDRGSMQQRD